MPRALPRPPGPGARECYARRLRQRIAAYPAVMAGPGDGCPWRDRLEQVEAGMPVEVTGYDLDPELRPPGAGPAARLRIESDGRVTVLPYSG